jgi:hypothetical protein
MPKTVFIFGAGASVESGAPTMKNFLDKAEEHSASSESVKFLFSKINDLHSILARTKVDLDNIEEVLGLIEMAELLNTQFHKDESDKLKYAYIKMISDTLTNSVRFDVKGPKIIIDKGCYQKLIEIIFKNPKQLIDTSFITFNYDLALDVALYSNDVKHSYYLDESDEGVPILKLHGSINWFKNIGPTKETRVFTINDYFTEFRISNIEKAPKDGIPLDLNKLINHKYGNYGYVPYIIPPTWNKTMYHNDISPVWRKAVKCVHEAENIIIIGYSMPDSDAFFRYFLSLGTNSPTRIKNLWVINPEDLVRNRFENLLGQLLTSRFRFFPAKFSEVLPNIGKLLESY